MNENVNIKMLSKNIWFVLKNIFFSDFFFNKGGGG